MPTTQILDMPLTLVTTLVMNKTLVISYHGYDPIYRYEVNHTKIIMGTDHWHYTPLKIINLVWKPISAKTRLYYNG